MQSNTCITKTNHTDILYFDGSCPLCTHEINLLRRLKGDNLSLIDIHSVNDPSAEGLPDKTEMLSILHLRDSNGLWKLGLDATVQAWSHTRIGWLLRPLRWPILGNFFDNLYLRWARNRVCKIDKAL